jgi:hypothetical protein
MLALAVAVAVLMLLFMVLTLYQAVQAAALELTERLTAQSA